MLLFEKMVSGERSYAIVELGQAPRTITKDDFEAGALQIMQAKLDTQAGELTAAKAELDVVKATAAEFRANAVTNATAASAAIANPALDDAATIEVIKAVMLQVFAPAVDRERAELQAQAAALAAKLAALG